MFLEAKRKSEVFGKCAMTVAVNAAAKTKRDFSNKPEKVGY